MTDTMLRPMHKTFASIRPSTPTEASQVESIILAYVTTYARFGTDCMKVSRGIASAMGIQIDWHDCASALDQLARNNLLVRQGFNDYGNNVYAL